MRKLAAEMRAICVENPDKIEGYQGSETETKAQWRAVAVAPSIIESGHLRFINYTVDHRLTNVVYTLMEISTGMKQWNLSMSHANPEGPQRVADDLAYMIAGAFLEEGSPEGFYEEVEPKAFWKTIRHFVKAAT